MNRVIILCLVVLFLSSCKVDGNDTQVDGIDSVTEQQLWDYVSEDKGAFGITTPTCVVNVRG